ncbi:MAG: hypothetical protein JW807_00940 [Spirochaetes bacterium]|nr:hypothetical protein [Spirochaetota bacterium]
MKTLKIINGDLAYENGSFVYITGAECLRQRLELSLRLDQGSWFLNPDAGIDWWSIYDSKYVSDRLIRAEVERVLLADEEVTAITGLNIVYDKEDRKINITFRVMSVYGEVTGEI